MKNEEHLSQCALFVWAELESRRIPELALLFAIPNGGKRNIVTAVKMKREGVKKGVPDVCLPVPRKNFHGLFIEMKSSKGKLTKEQLEWLLNLQAQGFAGAVCHNCEQAQTIIIKYLKGQLE